MTPGARHVAYLLKRFPRISETFVAAKLIELRRQGTQVRVFALARPPKPFTHVFLENLDVAVTYLIRRRLRQPIRTAQAINGLVRIPPGATIAAAGRASLPPSVKGWRRLGQAARLLRELKRSGIDHVHAYFASSATKLAHLTWQLGGPPYSVTARAKDIYHREVDPQRLREVLGQARFVATVSEDNVRYLKELLTGRGRVHLVRNAVDLVQSRVAAVEATREDAARGAALLARRRCVNIPAPRPTEPQLAGDLRRCGLP